MRDQFKTSVDSLTTKIDSFKNKLSGYTTIADNQFSRIDSVKNILSSLGIKQNQVSNFISGTFKSAQELSDRVKELVQNDQIRQNIYMVDNVPYKVNEVDGTWMPRTYYFKDLKTINGNLLPKFSKRPYIIGLSNDKVGLEVSNITQESFEMVVMSYSGERNLENPFLLTLIVIENK